MNHLSTGLIVSVIVIPSHARLLDCALHPLDLSVRPWMVWLGCAMLNPVCGADHIKPHWSRLRRVTVARLLTKLDAIIG